MKPKRKYPFGLFAFGLVSNFIAHFFWLFVPGILFLIIGIFVTPCVYVGWALLLIDLVLSIIDQLTIRRTFLSDSDHPGFRAFQDALSKDGNWRQNIITVVEEKIKNEIDSKDE